MNLTDQYFKALTVLVRHAHHDTTLTNEWVKVSMENAKRFADCLQRGRASKRDPETIAQDATASLWENLFVKGHPVKKSATTMLFYRVKHYAGYRTKKDDEFSYDAILENQGIKERRGTNETMQGVQEDNRGRFVLRGPQGNRGAGPRTGAQPPCRQLSRPTRRTIQKRGMEKAVPRYTQLTFDM